MEKKQLIAAKPCAWDVSTGYLNSRSWNPSEAKEKQMRFLRALNSGTPNRTTLTVITNGLQDTYYLGGLGQGDDYFNSAGLSLIKHLELTAALGHSKVTVY